MARTTSLLITRSALLPLALCLLPLSIVPAMAWGLGGQLSSVSYPPDWAEARAIMVQDERPGRLLVLPWHPHVPLRWNEGRVTLSPARAFFTRSVVTSDRLELLSGTLAPETPGGAIADALVRTNLPFTEIMPRLGTRYLILLKEADWHRYVDRLEGLEPAMDGANVALYLWPGPLEGPALLTPPRAAVLAGDFVTVLALGLMAVSAVRGRSRTDRHHEPRAIDRAAILQPHEEGGS